MLALADVVDTFGYMGWFSLDRLGFPVRLAEWMAVCAEAYRLWRSLVVIT